RSACSRTRTARSRPAGRKCSPWRSTQRRRSVYWVRRKSLIQEGTCAMTSNSYSPPLPSSWPRLLHLGVTALALLGLVAIAGLALAGRLHLGRRSAAPAPLAAATAQPAAAAKGEGGRYQIEPVHDMRRLIELAGGDGFFGELIDEAWVFHYKGGFLECK